MTKNFCDICGQPALEPWPQAKMEFPSLQWFGAKTHLGSPNPTEGTWVPFVIVRPVFDMENQNGRPNPHFPDLCKNCTAALLALLLEKVSGPTAPPF